jgi:hypothetical protein
MVYTAIILIVCIGIIAGSVFFSNRLMGLPYKGYRITHPETQGTAAAVQKQTLNSTYGFAVLAGVVFLSTFGLALTRVYCSTCPVY